MRRAFWLFAFACEYGYELLRWKAINWWRRKRHGNAQR